MDDKKKVYYTNDIISRKFIPGTEPDGWHRGKRKLTDEEKSIRKEKINNTLIKHYGSLDNATRVRLDKLKSTCIEKYGVDNVFKADFIKEKIKETNLDRYGVENPSQNDDIKLKKENTYREHYGVKCNFGIPEVLDKAILNSHCSEAQNKRVKTCLDKYGVENVAQVDEVKNKIKATCLDKYGVENAFQRPGIIKNFTNDSAPNKEFSRLLEDNNIKFEREFNVAGKRFDFILDGNILIDVNPSATHNSTWGIFNTPPKESDYHFNKFKLAKNANYRCIYVWDWDDKNKIINLLKNKSAVSARKCKVGLVSNEECNRFLNEHHLQGTCKNQKIRIGLFYNDELVSIMTLGKPRYNKNYEYELLRYCSSKNIIGGAEKLFKYFIKNYDPKSVISYCDNSKFGGVVYSKLGFILKSIGSPTAHWYNPKTKQHITDNLLRQRGFDQLFKTNYGKGTSNEELMLQHGFVKIYDCGQSSWEYIVNINNNY